MKASIKKIFLALIAAIIIAAAAGLYSFLKSPKQPASPSTQQSSNASFDGKNAAFILEGKSIILTNGMAEMPAAPGSASKLVTRYFGNEAAGDLNGDGIVDAAFLVTQDDGGSGLFYYVVAALKTSDRYKTTDAFFIGDRIAPQSTRISPDMELQVNYADRKRDEPMSVPPSVGMTLVLRVDAAGVMTVKSWDQIP